MAFSLFRRQKKTAPVPDAGRGIPAIRCSICTGEQVAGFMDSRTGRFEEVMLLRTPADLEWFRREYGVTGEITKIY